MKHVFYVVDDFNHNNESVTKSILYDNVVNKGIRVCKLCFCYERSITTDCPGFLVSHSNEDKIYNGQLDYKEGIGWYNPNQLYGTLI